MFRARLLIILSLVVAAYSPALAESPQAAPSSAERSQASVHFRRGVELFQEEAFRAALVEFQRAFDIAPDYRLLYNIGQTKLRLQDYLGSVQSYEAYLASGGADITSERRQQVEASLASLRERVGRIGVTCNRADAEVFIDDFKAGTTPLSVTVAVNVGRHRVLVRSADGASDAKVVDVAGGDVTDVSFVLAAPAQAQAAAPVPADGPAPWSSKQKAAVATWSAAGLLLAAGAVTGGLTWKAQSDLDASLETEGASSKSVSSERDSLKALALSTDILIGAGVVAAVTGTVLWVIGRPVKQDKAHAARGTSGSSLRLDVGIQSVRLRGQF